MGSLVDLRLLVGPNLYFPRPAVKLTLDVSWLLGVPVDHAVELAAAVGLTAARPGEPDSAFRQRFAARWAERIVRRVAAAAGVKRLGVRSRPGSGTDQLVISFPWRNAGRADALGEAVAAVLDEVAVGTPIDLALQSAGARVAGAPAGRSPALLRPTIPVVAVTGTNGKTTTARMLGHVARQAGLSVGWSSTDGVYLNGELVEAGDYSGPSGAGQVLAQPGVQLAITETARGGILRRGIGVAWNDVSVVTNVSADHLGLDGIDTLDQLAEVKAVITTVTRAGGWCVLNADDPRTFAMRLRTKAAVWVFSRDPDSPHGRTVLDAGGRVTTVLDGWVTVLRAGRDPRPIVPVAAVPMTLAGLSRVNVENVLAVTSAALALGFEDEVVATGLRSFDPAVDNPGRMNVWTRGGMTMIIDLAHNEAGLEALLEIARGVRPPGGRILLGVGTAGDRADDVFVRLGELAALGADVVEIVHKDDYLRGRSMDELGQLITAGAANAGTTIMAEHRSELAGLRSLVAQARSGDVVAVMSHQDREEIAAWLTEIGAVRATPAVLVELVAAAG